ncbi:hypothetical protein [Pectinatus sottacetonis]|uniref:hypothetical protein n=1 Tax=Pectinatus sottacetonis TaxID=1002795 RepID=UPI001E4D739F|nr:hypothetical protein [Pectinatus sottacetonis]
MKQYIHETYQFPVLAKLKYLIVGRQVELIVYVENFSKWERALLQYSNEATKFGKYYPLLLGFIKTHVLPRKEKSYGSNVRYYHLFKPCNIKTMSYSISLTVYEDNIFKHLTKTQGISDDAMASDISKYYREQNLRGPEWVSVVSLDKIFIAVVIYGVSSPFWKRYQQISPEIKTLFTAAIERLSKEAVEYSLEHHKIKEGKILFMDFQSNDDTVFVVVVRSIDKWEDLLISS